METDLSDHLNPLIRLRTPFGDDHLNYQVGTLHGTRFTMRERISRPFELRLTTVSTRQTIDPNSLLHRPVTATIKPTDNVERHFNGVVRKVTSVADWLRDRATYVLDIVPTLWFLSQSQDCRIFQQMSVVDILREILGTHGVTKVEFNISRTPPKRDYVTQYNETDLLFVHRLLQEAGLFYFFLHSPDEHMLVITDHNQSFLKVDQPLHRLIKAGNNTDVFNAWKSEAATAPGSVATQDYDLMRPANPVRGRAEATIETPGDGQRQLFRWPALTFDNPVANDRARFRIEAEEAAAGSREARGCDPTLYPGSRFTLKEDPVGAGSDVDLAVLEVAHEGIDETSAVGVGEPPSYSNQVTCFPQSTPWREPLDIPRPPMAGIYSGVTLGEGDEEIHADPLGRIKVRLMFDHRMETTAGQGIWVRVAQPWAGDGWGWQHLPRVGTEVAVAFMNGDPDDPVVVGGLYNQSMQPLFPSKTEQTKSGFRSRSTPHGSADEYCELSFDDRKGKELVFVQAQKDHRTKVKHDQSLKVENDRDVTIGHDETVTVGRDHRLISLTGDISVTAVDGAVEITALQSLTLRVLDNVIRISPTGIAMNGTLINLSATGALNAQAPVVNLVGEATVAIAAPLVFSTPPPVPNPEPEIQAEELTDSEIALLAG